MALNGAHLFAFVLLIGSPDFEKSMDAHGAPLSPRGCKKFIGAFEINYFASN